jgi:hypothetical protein
LATEYRSEKIPRNRLGMVFVIPRKKVVIPRHSEIYGRVNSEARNGTELHEKNGFYKKSCSRNRIGSMFFSETCFGTEFREFASFSVPRNRILSWFLLLGIVWNEILRVCLYFVPWYRIPSFFLLCGKIRSGIPRKFSVQRNRRNSAETNKFFRLFRLPRNNFLVGNCPPPSLPIFFFLIWWIFYLKVPSHQIRWP